MIPLQVASSGRPGTEPTSRHRTYKNQEGGKGVGVRKKNEKCTLSGLPDDPSAGCLFRSSWNGTYKQKQNV